MERIYIESFECNGEAIKAKTPVVFFVHRLKRFWLMATGAFGMCVFGANRESLKEAIEADLSFIWRHYALENDERLTPQAQAMKRDLLNAFERESHEKEKEKQEAEENM